MLLLINRASVMGDQVSLLEHVVRIVLQSLSGIADPLPSLSFGQGTKERVLCLLHIWLSVAGINLFTVLYYKQPRTCLAMKG